MLIDYSTVFAFLLQGLKIYPKITAIYSKRYIGLFRAEGHLTVPLLHYPSVEGLFCETEGSGTSSVRLRLPPSPQGEGFWRDAVFEGPIA